MTGVKAPQAVCLPSNKLIILNKVEAHLLYGRRPTMRTETVVNTNINR